MTKKIPKSECPDPSRIADWLRQETGGAVVAVARPTDCGDHWQIAVTSFDGLNQWPGPAAAGRCMFRVIGEGVVTDGTKYRDPVTRESSPILYSFPKSMGLEIGTVFSAAVPMGESIDPDSIFVERNPDGSVSEGERKGARLHDQKCEAEEKFDKHG